MVTLFVRDIGLRCLRCKVTEPEDDWSDNELVLNSSQGPASMRNEMFLQSGQGPECGI